MGILNKIFHSLLWCLPFMISGFSAPVIFRHAPTPLIGGHYAGILFLLAGAWALVVSCKHSYPRVINIFFIIFLGQELIFWSWRFSNDTPLKESSKFGINGGAWHLILTSFYLAVLLTLFVVEYRKTSLKPLTK